MSTSIGLTKYDRLQSYEWNDCHCPEPVEVDVLPYPGEWTFCGRPVDSPLGIPAGPLLNGKWCLYYASLGFDVVTYKTVRSVDRACYAMPNLQPVDCDTLTDAVQELPAIDEMRGSWAVSYGMPSKTPKVWQDDVEWTRHLLPDRKILSVSVVATVQEGWSIDDIATDYAQCARWAVNSGADVIETNFSCPNVSTCDGQLYQHPQDAQIVAERVRQAIGSVPYIAKIGHVPSAESAAELLEALAPSVTALAMTNSVATQVRQGDSLLFDGERRGICGSAILDASVAQTELFNRLIQQSGVAVELIGVGGAGCVDDVQRYITAGAHACHIATAAMTDPNIAIRIRQELYTATTG
jgi:dihydroorotate dehydrogenase (NAD+) catalytic subunit